MSLKGVELPLVFKFINAIYRALIERFGEDSWEILWRSGEILFKELKDDIGVTEDMEINHAVQRLCDYIRRVRLVDRIEYIFNEDKSTIETVVHFPFSIDMYKREMAGPIYIFSSLLASVLNYIGYRVERSGEHYIMDRNKLVEKWKVTKL